MKKKWFWPHKKRAIRNGRAICFHKWYWEPIQKSKQFKKKDNLSVKKPQPVEYARKKACNPGYYTPIFCIARGNSRKVGATRQTFAYMEHRWNRFSKSKVVGIKNHTSTSTIASPGKDTTVLLGCNAIREKAPPVIVYKGKNVWTTEEGYPGTAYAATPNGWMETAVFEAFFEKVFLPLGEKRPILLVYDEHSNRGYKYN